MFYSNTPLKLMEFMNLTRLNKEKNIKEKKIKNVKTGLIGGIFNF